MFVLHLITLHIGHKKHKSSSHIYEEDVHKIWGHVFISKWAVGSTTVLLAQASKIFAKKLTLAVKSIAKVKLPPDET
jgi:hypothetical protein